VTTACCEIDADDPARAVAAAADLAQRNNSNSGRPVVITSIS
jgi:hypothetical protein